MPTFKATGKMKKITPELQAYHKAYRLANAEKIKAYSDATREKYAEAKRVYERARRRENKTYFRAVDRKKRGLPLATRPEPKHCELCGGVTSDGRAMSLDHCHVTGVFRGWLCSNCNTAIGLMKDNPVLLERAADYVRFMGVI